MLVQILAAAALLLFLWSFFRFAMGLRAAKLLREEQRQAHEASGRRVVTELPLQGDDGVIFFLEARDGFYWGASSVSKSELRGASLVYNGFVVDRRGDDPLQGARSVLPEFEGQERWEVSLALAGGIERTVACGKLREGISRAAASAVFAAVCATLRDPIGGRATDLPERPNPGA